MIHEHEPCTLLSTRAAVLSRRISVVACEYELSKRERQDLDPHDEAGVMKREEEKAWFSLATQA